jgi:hypothetical protein
MKQSKDINIQQGGYSGTGMLPFYALFSSAIFFLAPFIGFGWSTALVYIAGIITAAVAQAFFSSSETLDNVGYQKAYEQYKLSANMRYPKYQDYIVVTPSVFSKWISQRSELKVQKTIEKINAKSGLAPKLVG